MDFKEGQIITKHLDGAQVIGKVVIYSLEDVKVKSDDLKDYFAKSGLDMNFFPAGIKGVDAFRRSFKEAGICNKASNTNQIICREVADDADKVVRILERRVPVKFETKKLELEYEHIATITFNKGNETVSTCLFKQDKQTKDTTQNIINKYVELSSHFTIEHIRGMIKNVFRYCNAVLFRNNGGVSFVPIKYESTITALDNVIRNISSGCQLLLLDLGDSEEHRSIVKQKVEEDIKVQISELHKIINANGLGLEAKESISDMINEFSNALCNKEKLNKKMANNLLDKFSEKKQLLFNYRQLLQDNISELETYFDILRKQVDALIQASVEGEEC